LSPENTLQREIATEQRHLDRVYARLAQLRQDAQAAERDGYRIAKVGNHGALVERDAVVRHAARRRATLDAEHEGLVFGRLDRRGGAVQYVGRLGIRDADATPLVIDWRAPAAADFYQATPADPRGVVRRRMIRSQGETVTGLDDDLLDPGAELPVVGDGAMLASLARATGPGMRDIVATIQREQDEAIRSPAGGVTVVEGGPGTGKTAVALHRAAYLLYRDRARFAGGGVLVVGPSPVFMSYISTVLPSLGEQSATLRALGELVEGVRAARTDPVPLAATKGSLRMLTVLRRAVREQVPGAPRELRLVWRGTLLRLDATTLERVRRRALAGRRRRNEVRRAAFDGIFDALWEDLTGQGAAHHRPREEFEDELSDRPEFRDFLRAWWPLLRPLQVLAWLADPKRLRRLADGTLSAAEVTALAESFARVAAHGPTVADVALLDELDTLLGRPPRPPRRPRDPYLVAPGVREVTTLADRQAAARAALRERPEDYRDYAHVVVDEAQDVSPMQWRMLGRRGRYASWTVVGDPAQSAWTGDPAELTRAREAALRGRPTRRYTLTTNYRNSVEIFSLAASVIRTVAPDLPLPAAVRATGVPPTHHLVAPDAVPETVRAAVAALLGQVAGTVGVITPGGRRDQVAGWLAGADPGLGDPRLQVVTSLEAKGMEYDGVVLVEPAEIVAQAGPDRPAGVRTLYVALSRATQRLTTVASTPWRD
jgi:DNA helicase IV